jgi:hypothetical protein
VNIITELVNEIRQRLPMEFRDVLRYVTAKTGKKCILLPDFAEEKEHQINVGENVYTIVNHDFEVFEVVCQGKSVKIPIASIIYVLLADKDIDKTKLYVADLDVVEGE